MDKKYEICTYNTFTKRMEKVAVSKEVYTAYKRSGWNIKDNNQSFYDHEIHMRHLMAVRMVLMKTLMNLLQIRTI